MGICWCQSEYDRVFMANWVKMDGQWKRQENIARVDNEDDRFEQLQRDEQEYEEHLDRVFTFVPTNNVIDFCCEEVSVDIITQTNNTERIYSCDDNIISSGDNCSTTTDEEIVIAAHLKTKASVDVLPNVSNDLNNDVQPILERIQKLEEDKKKMADKIHAIQKRLEESDAQIDNQYEYIEFLEKRINHLDQYGRRENIEISGIPNHIIDSKLEEEVVKILRKIGLTNIDRRDIVGCHRLRSKDRWGVKNVIVRFVNRKDAIFALKSKHKLKTCAVLGYHNLRLFENLCPLYRSMYESLSGEMAKGNIKQLWTYNGTINYKVTHNEWEIPKKLHVESDIDRYFRNLKGGGQ